MSDSILKRPPLKLAPIDYEHLRNRVLARDHWTCQFCGSMESLEVHHQRFRSQAGSDVEENLITLCHECHGTVHGPGTRVQAGGIESTLKRKFNNMQGDGWHRSP